MSREGIEAKKLAQQHYFNLHPDSQEVKIVGSETTFNAFFDWAYMTSDEDGGNIEQKKRVPHLTFYTANAELLTARVTQLEVNNDIFTVYTISTDKTEETFQGEAWLI